MSISFTGITIYKTDMKNPYYKFANAVKDKHLEKSIMVAPCTQDNNSVLILDGEDYTNYLKRMAMLNEVYYSWAVPSLRERKTLEKNATVVDLRGTPPTPKKVQIFTEGDVRRINDEMMKEEFERSRKIKII